MTNDAIPSNDARRGDDRDARFVVGARSRSERRFVGSYSPPPLTSRPEPNASMSFRVFVLSTDDDEDASGDTFSVGEDSSGTRGLIRGPWRGRDGDGDGVGAFHSPASWRCTRPGRGVSFEYARAGYLGARVRASSRNRAALGRALRRGLQPRAAPPADPFAPSWRTSRRGFAPTWRAPGGRGTALGRGRGG